MFSIKICGVTQPDQAVHAVQSGADAIGLNFYAPSPRSVSQDKAREIADAIRAAENLTKKPTRTVCVGVFVNHSCAEVMAIVNSVGLDAVQLHGDEPPEFVAELSPLPVIRAFRMKPDDQKSILQFVTACRGNHPLQSILVDAAVPGQYGGTGEKADWNQVARLKESMRLLEGPVPQLVLAGGLVPSNVASAIATAHPDAVDTASGVESSAGQKDSQSVTQFIANARRALDAT